ncbi:hypothetical protein F6V25_04335 [Oryzomonas japonica]|uniref:Doubled CXXCH motif domain-containing protein n=1 Tax=Oryzomonas japonica TaxID=2603858 RepID=A0A7J4ZTH2_9BACT|nr:hypothetical protein [Oryzomonas japonica]KAB0666653.1 hypothetical protein F6V25_04335 [Oryzomonas japonica]
MIMASVVPIVFCYLNATAAFCGWYAGTGVSGSKHDLNMFSSSSDLQERVCIYCHVPHHAAGDTLASTPVWDEVKSGKVFTPYKSATFDATVVDPLVGPTRLCLSCHDGVVASDNHPNLRSDSYGGAGIAINGDLSNDHPVGFSYLEVVNNKPNAYRSPNALWLDGNGSVTVASCLYNNAIVTCVTCHDPHNKKNVSDPNNTYNYFVYSRQAHSSLCQSCHIK